MDRRLPQNETRQLCVLFVTTSRSMKFADTTVSVKKKQHSDSCFKQLGPSRKDRRATVRHGLTVAK